MAMFEQKRAWIDHEMEKHWRSWFCYLCKFSSDQQSEVESHLGRHHPEALSEEVGHTMTYMTSRPLDYIDASRCPLCDWEKVLLSKNSVTTVSRASFMGHLAYHLEQLALFALPRVNSGDKSGSLHSNIAANQDWQASQSTEKSSFARKERSVDSSIKEGPSHSNDSSMEGITDSEVVSLATINQAFPSESRGADATSAWMVDTDPHIPEDIADDVGKMESLERDDREHAFNQLCKHRVAIFSICGELANSETDNMSRQKHQKFLREIFDKQVKLIDILRAAPSTTFLLQDITDEYAAITNQLHSHYFSQKPEVYRASKEVSQEAERLMTNLRDVHLRFEMALARLAPSLAGKDLPQDQSDGTPLQDEVVSVTLNTDTTAPVVDTTRHDVAESSQKSQEKADEMAGTTQPELDDHRPSLEGQAHETISSEEITAKRNDFLSSLWYPEMFDRQQSISPPCADTFDWIYDEAPVTGMDSHNPSDNSFPLFLRGDQSLFWISGKSGSGKSTIMRMIESDRRTQEHLSVWAQPVRMASFYFGNKGCTLQGSIEGLLRSLLYQLLQDEPSRTYSPTSAKEWGHPSWTTSDLLRLLMETLHELSSARVYLMMDGLDECEGEQLELFDLIYLLRTLDCVKICVASRPMPFMVSRLMRPPDLMLDDANAGDIPTFVRARSAELPEDLAMTLIERSEGSISEAAFLVDVVEPMLNRGASEEMVRRRLDEMFRGG
jgi:hypothetical protein